MNRREWSEWTRELRPDEVTSARLRRAIAEQAGPLLAARRDDWWSVASGWSGVLIPAAAVITLVFGGIALRQGAGGETVALEDVAPVESVVETLWSETVPAGFSEAAATDDVVFAALGEAARDRRPARTPPAGPGVVRP